MFGSRSLGSSLSPGNRGFAGGSATGARGAGSQGVLGATQRNDGTVGQFGANDRFVRGNRQAGAFVGADTSDVPAALTQLFGGSGMSGQRGRSQQQGRQGSQGNPNQAQSGRSGGGRMAQQQTQYRISRSLGFNYTMPPAPQLQTQLGERLKALPSVKTLGPIDVSLQQRTVVLRGTVATAHDRDLAERLALLEAGVDLVQNELTIAPPANAAAPPAAAAAAPSPDSAETN
jgi:osmotically-inducible protein OsmY